MNNQTEVLLNEDVIDSVGQLFNHINEQTTLTEMSEDKEVSFLTLLNRMGEETTEKVMQEVMDSYSTLMGYKNHHLSDIPPG